VVFGSEGNSAHGVWEQLNLLQELESQISAMHTWFPYKYLN